MQGIEKEGILDTLFWEVRIWVVQFDPEFDLKVWDKTKDNNGLPKALPYRPANYTYQLLLLTCFSNKTSSQKDSRRTYYGCNTHDKTSCAYGLKISIFFSAVAEVSVF